MKMKQVLGGFSFQYLNLYQKLSGRNIRVCHQHRGVTDISMVTQWRAIIFRYIGGREIKMGFRSWKKLSNTITGRCENWTNNKFIYEMGNMGKFSVKNGQSFIYNRVSWTTLSGREIRNEQTFFDMSRRLRADFRFRLLTVFWTIQFEKWPPILISTNHSR